MGISTVTGEQQHDNRRQRNSSIELLKIVALAIIVISHTVQTLTSPDMMLSWGGHAIDVSSASDDPVVVTLLVLRHFGVWGNDLFFICSAWFLLKQDKWKKQKWFQMIVEIWVVSVVILVFSFVALRGHVGVKDSVKSLFPTIFANNWYMTCYLLFYPLHTVLNHVIRVMSQRQLWRAALALSVLYLGLNFLDYGLFFVSDLIVWVAVYFVMAYMQRYGMRFADSRSFNLGLILGGGIGYIGGLVIWEILGNTVQPLSGKMLHWDVNSNLFILLLSIGMFNLARRKTFHNRFINYISSLSLLMYIIHENLLLRTYFRPRLWIYTYKHFGYSHVLGWVFVWATLIFLFAVLAAMVYRLILGKGVSAISSRLYNALRRRCLAVEDRMFGNARRSGRDSQSRLDSKQGAAASSQS